MLFHSLPLLQTPPQPVWVDNVQVFTALGLPYFLGTWDKKEPPQVVRKSDRHAINHIYRQQCMKQYDENLTEYFSRHVEKQLQK
ncbi:UNVERIFIED_CONTAM: hypothetical protein FKN15_009521 [Acipenser sinensis]